MSSISSDSRGSSDTVAYCIKAEEFKLDDVLRLLENINEALLSKKTIQRPLATQVYVYDYSDLVTKDDWVADGYRWINCGTDKLPRNKPCPVIVKRKFKVWTEDGGSLLFKRISYNTVASPKHILVHYIGDESVACFAPHANSKRADARPFQRSAPSVLTRVAMKLAERQPSLVHKETVAAADCVVDMPRNFEQVRNVRKQVFNARKLSNDALANLHDIAYDTPDFIWTIQTYPDQIVVAGRSEMLTEMNRLLQLGGKTHMQLLSYDTTFNFGEFYISALLFRGTCFAENPVFPAMFLVHERKLKSTHKVFVDIVKDKVPFLNNSNAVLVTDGEAGFDVFEEVFPKLNKVFCWNHILSSSKHWMHTHGATSADITVYVDHIRTLLHCPNGDDYDKSLCDMRKLWSQSFSSYFDQQIQPHMGTKIGRPLLERLNCYSNKSGITQNMSEGFNTVMRRLNEWKEAPLDTALLALYQLHGYFINAIRLGYGDHGDYHLIHNEYPQLKSIGEVKNLQRTDAPSEIIAEMKRRALAFVESAKTLEVHADNTQRMSDVIRSQTLLETATESIQFNAAMKCFLVRGTGNEVRLVKFNPKPSCSCRSAGTCYHISSVKKVIGLAVSPTKRCINLTQLRRNKRTVIQKPGKKRPRKGDYDVKPAPDAESLLDNDEVHADDVKFNDDDNAIIDDEDDPNVIQLKNEIDTGKLTEQSSNLPLMSSKDSVPTTPSTVSVSEDVPDTDATNSIPELDRSTCPVWMQDLINPTVCLNDCAMNMAQHLLRCQYQNSGGLLDTVVVAASATNNSQSGKLNVIQIVYDRVRQHWLTLTNTDCLPGTVSIYCSLQLLPSPPCIETIAQLFQFESRAITLNVMNTHRQLGSSDCGLFAVGYAEMLARQQEPCNVVFEQQQMRHHLSRCFKVSNIDPFPLRMFRSPRRHIVRTSTLSLYCVCRSTVTGTENMVQCDACGEWYHQKCVALGDDEFKQFSQPSAKYECQKCENDKQALALTTDISVLQQEERYYDPTVELLPNFMNKVAVARTASMWLNENKELMVADVEQPSMLLTSDDELKMYAQQQFHMGATLEDLNDDFMFSFANEDDISIFTHNLRDKAGLPVSYGLLSTDFVKNNSVYNKNIAE